MLFEEDTDVEKLAQEVYREYPTSPKDKPDWTYNRDIHAHKKRKAFIKGYRAAQKSNKQFSLEDMKKAIQFGLDGMYGYKQGKEGETEYQMNEYIQSLSNQQLPKNFILGKGNTIEEQIKNGYYE